MEVLLGLGLAGLVLMAPVLAIVALARASRLQRELGEAAARISGLETKLESLAKRVVGGASAPVAPGAKPEGPPPAPTPVTPPPPPVDTAPRTLPPPQAQQPPQPPPPPPAAVVTPPAAAAAVPQPPSTVVPQPPPPPRPRPTPPPPPAEPPAPAFDWESLLGLKGAAWLGGIAIVIAGIFFAKWTLDQGLITPALRIAGLIFAGAGALVWAELSLRRGYDTTANSVSGAGIALLYIAFYAGHALYNLFSLPVTFALMALVTVTAGVLAIRYDAFFTAVLGLLGGFATPLALSTGVDRPLGLFSYLLVLGIGLLTVARRQRWPGLVRLGLACTVLIQALWFFRYMSPAKMAIGLGSFFVLGLVYTLASLFDTDDKSDAKAPSSDVATVAGLVPFAFALILAGGRDYAGEWPLLFGYVALLDLALAALALFRRERISLLLAASGATALLLAIWPMWGLGHSVLWGPVLAAIGLAALLNLPAELARRLNEGDAVEQAPAFEGAGLIAAFGLLLFSAVLVFKGLGEPPWAFVVLVLALFLLLVLRTGEARLPQVFAGGALALGVLVQMWFFREEANGTALLRDLSLPLLLPVALSLVAALRAQAPLDADDDEAGVVVATALTLMGLFGCLGSETRANDAWPLFLALAVADVLLVVSALRRGWAVLVPAALAASALFAFAWHEGHFQLADLSVALPAYLAFTFAFLVLPFVVASAGNRIWQGRSAPWLASACAAPAFFPVIYRAFVAAWGKAWIGVLPVSLAVVSVVALAAANRQLSGSRSDERLRLRHLALFGAVALGFITLAIPLQLDRQWITVGWALEAVAVWWLFGRLPHPGLKFLGVALLAAVGVRLLVNPEVLRYQPRGLPILNWLLYTYGVPALSCFVGAAVLARAEAARKSPPDYDWVGGDRTQIGPAASVLGLLLTFWLINLEVFDYFSRGRYVELAFERQFARDLTLSAAWGLYAIVLLVLGLWRSVRPLRMAALAFLVLTVAKVFLYDLSTLTGLYRVLSFLGLGVSLIFVSLLYQRFVIARRDE